MSARPAKIRRRNVLVTHADEPIGRRVVKALMHDAGVGRVMAVGEGPPPRAFDRFAAEEQGIEAREGRRVDLS